MLLNLLTNAIKYQRSPGRVESTVGRGSCCWFELAAAPPVLGPDPPLRTVLCVEGDATRWQRIEDLVAGWPELSFQRTRAASPQATAGQSA